MSYIGQAPGQGQRVPFRFVATAGQTTFSGVDANGYPFGYTPGLVDVFVNDGFVTAPNYTAGDGSTLIFAQGLNALDEVTVLAQAPFSPANTYTMAQADSFQRRRNRIVDPGMRVSQEQGSNLLTLATGTTAYPSDGFYCLRIGSTGSATVQRIALATPGGSPYRIRATVTAANAAPAAGDILAFGTKIEGLDTADLKFGGTSARTIAIRFGCRVSVAGTYGIALLNGSANNRSWLGVFTIAPNEVGVDVVKTVSLVGDQTGSWATDTSSGFQINVTLLAGINYQGVLGWQAGTLFSTAACTNLMATNGATLDLFDVGLYDVTGLQSGVIPPFELDSFDRDLAKCQRYYNYIPVVLVSTIASAANQYFYLDISIPYMRTNASTLFVNTSYSNSSGLALNGNLSAHVRLSAISSAAGVAIAVSDVALNARL